MAVVNIQTTQSSFDSSILTIVVCCVITVAFFYALYSHKKGILSEFVVYSPALLTSLGIFGTFAGIVLGLMDFDPNNIDESIEGLLDGLKTAFLTSLYGIFLSILFKVLQTTRIIKAPSKVESSSHASPEDILNTLRQQNANIEILVDCFTSDSEKSVLNQIKLVRADITSNQKLSIVVQKETKELLSAIQLSIETQQKEFFNFSEKLWVQMQDFADLLSKSATETVIEALKQVITDFNNNLTEQFGENFKQLNEAVKELVIWQQNYKVQISEMTEQYKLGVASISATEESVSKISTESKAIPETMSNLKEVMDVNQHQLNELERHLEAFKDIRDRAVEAVPEIRKQIDETVKTIADSVESASSHYKELLTESDKYIQTHITSSNELLEKFVSNTKDGVNTIGEKLADSANKVEKVISEGANEFTDKVHQTNAGLQTTADHLTSQTEVIKNHLKDTVQDLNEHVRQMIHTLVDDSKALGVTLTEANKALITDTTSVRDSVSQSIESMQKRLENSLEDVFASQTQHMNKVFSNIDASLKDQVGKTGEAVEKQLSMIDQSMQQELNRVMSEMGKALGQISNQFVNDYSRLVKQMNSVVAQAV